MNLVVIKLHFGKEKAQEHKRCHLQVITNVPKNSFFPFFWVPVELLNTPLISVNFTLNHVILCKYIPLSRLNNFGVLFYLKGQKIVSALLLDAVSEIKFRSKKHQCFCKISLKILEPEISVGILNSFFRVKIKYLCKNCWRYARYALMNSVIEYVKKSRT